MLRHLLLFSLPLVAGSAAIAQGTVQLESVGQASIVDSTTQTEDIRFRNDHYDRMTVPVRLKGSGPYRFLVDTGADRTAISRELAGRLKLPAGQSASLHTLGGVSSVATANVAGLQLTREHVDLNDAALLDRANIGADGILGVDSLRSQRVMFDFEAQTMSIVPSAFRDLESDPNAIVVRAKRRNGRLVISEALLNDRPATIVLDTGAQISVGNQALRRQLLGNGVADPTHTIQLVTVTGQPVSGEFAYIDKLEIGGLTLKKLAIVFTDAHTFKALKLDKKPALLLGMNAMRAFKKMSIDFAAKKLRIVLPEHSSLDVRMARAEPRRRS